MFNASTKTIPVRTTPTARVYVDGLYVGDAPTQITLTSASSHTVDIEADGYERQSTRIESRTSAGYVVLDCVLLVFFIVPGIIALAVDGGSGDWKVLDTDQLVVKLNPLPKVPAVVPIPAPTPPVPAPPAPEPLAPVQPGAPIPETPQPSSGCQFDAQCKGERICRAGECVDPEPDP